MTERSVLVESRIRRRALERQRRRRRRQAGLAVVALLAVAAGLLVVWSGPAGRPRRVVLRPHRVAAPRRRPAPRPARHPLGYGAVPAPASEQIHPRATFHIGSGILFDVSTGRVLWAQSPGRRLPIASLTKMMTALVVSAHSATDDQVLITPEAVHFSGSGVGLLPLGKRVGLVSLLYGLLLPSGNDAAIALAEHVAGTEARFVALMNERARAMGLMCTHFASASGLVDRDNYSCTRDLAVLAHAVLRQRLLSRIVASRSAVIPFPIKGGKLYLYNNNPLLLARYRGVDGVKTGYTVAAGPCLVASARRGGRWLAVVLLHSVDPAGEAQKLLDAGFARLGAA